MWWHKKSIPSIPRTSVPYDSDQALLHFGNDKWSLRDSYEGAFITGQIGSGKTTGSGAAIAKSFLRAQYGGLVVVAKPGERQMWEEYAAQCNRENHLIIVSPHEDPRHHVHWRFNFLEYERQRSGTMGGGLTENMVHLFTNIIEIVEGKRNVPDGDNFWERTMRQLVRNSVELLRLAGHSMSVTDIVKLVLEAPKTEDQPYDEKWRQTSLCAICLREADEKVSASGNRNDRLDYETVFSYFCQDFAGLSDRTKTSIITTFTSMADMLSHGYTRDLLTTTTNMCPELAFDGAIIIVDLPIQHFHAVGRTIQCIFKYMFQRAVLARDITHDPRPVFLWADEAQGVLTTGDYEFQSVARASRCATVYLTQNISNMYQVLGAGGRDAANSLLGNFGTKIFHANGDVPTNTYAADLIGQHWTRTGSSNVSHNHQGDSTSAGSSDSVQQKILPSTFTTLRKGGPSNGGIVEGIVFQGGRIWQETHDTWIKAKFEQSLS